MLLWILSDLHVELTHGWDLPSGDARPQFDVLVVAGDLIPRMERGVKWLHERLQDRPVIYVPGNHEAYGCDIDRTVEKAKATAAGTNIHVLQHDVIRIGEVTFAGATLWTDKYKFSSGSTDPYQTVRGWLLHYLSITRRLERNAEGEAKMSGEKSSDAGLSAAERKTLRSREAEEAIAEHESAQKAFHENRERLREERLRREAAAGPMLYPAPELPDDTPVENVRFTTRIRKTLHAAGLKTIGDVRDVSDAALLSLPDFGSGSLSYLREALGLPSIDGVRPKIKKPT
ncbi:hypothetical protein V1290_005647 [Bradyrhizobium sp. AZCC 1578]|uniref:metallophosphoesterase n=1 Tax=unclassified Bradyrhizobium TaxID=2631580 RepID=UPI002FF23255